MVCEEDNWWEIWVWYKFCIFVPSLSPDIVSSQYRGNDNSHHLMMKTRTSTILSLGLCHVVIIAENKIVSCSRGKADLFAEQFAEDFILNPSLTADLFNMPETAFRIKHVR